MDWRSLMMSPVHAGESVVRNVLSPDMQPDPNQEAAKQNVLDLLAKSGKEEAAKFSPPPAKDQFQLPTLDDSLTPEAQQAKKEAEARGETFTPGEDDYTDSGPFGYLHKKQIHDALMEYKTELDANAPHIDYEGIMRQRLQDIANGPAEHRTNPLYLFAMGMGNPEHAAELVKTHNQAEADANAKQAKRWQDLLDMKQQALEGSIQQALQEGDHRKIIAGKWLDQLAQIEQDKSKMGMILGEIGARNQGSLERTDLRGRWMLAAAKARSDAMVQAHATSLGMKADSAVFRSIQRDGQTMAQNLMRYGKLSPEDAYDQAEQWVEDKLDSLPKQTGNTPIVGAGNTPAAAPTNEMQAQIEAARKAAAAGKKTP